MKQSILTTLVQIGIIVLIILSAAFCSTIPPSHGNISSDLQEIRTDLPEVVYLPGEEIPVSTFNEIWAYVVAGREAALTRGLPISDIGYFGAEISSFGALVDVPRRQNLNFTGRVHLVVACNGRALSYFTLREGSEERKKLIDDLIDATRTYDGLQIDFENVPDRSREDYQSFLRELRARLPSNKMFTVALAARTRKLTNDVYDYETILPYVDRILIMAYDEHWSGSKPGSVASLDWCLRVAEYSLRTIGREKLIMGLPFYGRAWGDYSPSRALVYTTIENIIKDNDVTDIRYDNGIPTFVYDKSVSVTLYFENEYSLATRMQMYSDMNINKIGFWRLGQETTDVWKYIRLVR